MSALRSAASSADGAGTFLITGSEPLLEQQVHLDSSRGLPARGWYSLAP